MSRASDDIIDALQLVGVRRRRPRWVCRRRVHNYSAYLALDIAELPEKLLKKYTSGVYLLRINKHLGATAALWSQNRLSSSPTVMIHSYTRSAVNGISLELMSKG